MDRDDIDDIVCEIMMHNGPDGHIDGHGIITDFIMALLNQKGEEWGQNYMAQIAREEEG